MSAQSSDFFHPTLLSVSFNSTAAAMYTGASRNCAERSFEAIACGANASLNFSTSTETAGLKSFDSMYERMLFLIVQTSGSALSERLSPHTMRRPSPTFNSKSIPIGVE